MRAENTIFEFEAPGYDLEATLFCGQSFGWRRMKEGIFSGVAGTRSAKVWHQSDILYVKPYGEIQRAAEEKAFWRHYFAVNENYERLLKRFCTNKHLEVCVGHSPGMRVLRQPFYDTLLSFILSQNNNIQRITALCTRLREEYGEPVGGGEYAYPRPEVLGGYAPEQLAPLRAGFRAKYLVDAARKVALGEVNEERLGGLSDEEARAGLMQIYGVGEKVADCVLLYGMGRDRVVPMDVWMKRAMDQTFPRGMPHAAKGREGIAQQFIFCWARDRLIVEKTDDLGLPL